MERKVSNHRFYTSKHKLKPVDVHRRNVKPSSRCSDTYMKIPKVIQQLEKNLNLLKKYYEEDEYLFTNGKVMHKGKNYRPKSSDCKKSKKNVEQEISIVPELEDVKKSFLSVHGYDSNNVVELYNFYKKNLEKSTRIFASNSGINSTHNFSDIRENRRPTSALIVDSTVEENISELKPKFNDIKANQKMALNLMRRNNELVNVASLLAERKKISRENICQNINSDSLCHQAKKKLMRPNAKENIERVVLQENKRTENLRISPARKQVLCKNQQLKSGRFRGSASKSHKKSAIKTQKNSQESKKEIKQFSPIIHSNTKSNSRKTPTANKESHQPKSSKSIRSPSLNKGLIFQCQEFNHLQSPIERDFLKFKENKKKANELTDSLLQCEISIKENSKIIDLQQVPFDF